MLMDFVWSIVNDKILSGFNLLIMPSDQIPQFLPCESALGNQLNQVQNNGF